eukprot:COSAG04_NODE_3287_length_2971_cov_10.541086_2_plen_57_part_00
MLKFIEYVYDIFGMTFEVMLSTRPPTVSHGRHRITCRLPPDWLPAVHRGRVALGRS